MENSKLKIDALLKRSRNTEGVGEQRWRIRHYTSDGPIGERVPQTLIDNQHHTIITRRVDPQAKYHVTVIR